MIDEIHAKDFIDLLKMPLYHKKRWYYYVLINFDVFSKYCWCFIIPNKSVGELEWTYDQIWSNKKLSKIWFDRVQAIDSNLFKQFMVVHYVELYHTISLINCSVAMSIIRTL